MVGKPFFRLRDLLLYDTVEDMLQVGRQATTSSRGIPLPHAILN